MALVRLPDRFLPPPREGVLPAAPGLRAMLGPGIILVGLSIGSGEFVLWPRLTAQWGFALFWACWIGVTIQFFLNMEIERYTLATGESAVTGFVRLSPIFGPVFILCGTLPWIWPGWATGAATLLSWQVGGPVGVYAVAGLVLCGLLLSLGPVVYRTVETIQIGLVGLIFALVLVLSFLVIPADSVRGLVAGALQVGHVPEGMNLPLLLGALAFAGAGGTGNLAQSNYIKDKGYGMGRFIGRLTSPFTGREEGASEVGIVFGDERDQLLRWRVWWRRANLEHLVTFYFLCLLSLALFCLLTHALLAQSDAVPEGIGFIREQSRVLSERFGPFASRLFLLAGTAVLFSTELGILDAVTRVVADLVKVTYLREHPRWGLSRLYLVILWSFIGFGIAILLAGFTQPLALLVLSASLNAVVMFLYSGLLFWLGWRCYERPLRPSPLRFIALVVSFCFFGYFTLLTIADWI